MRAASKIQIYSLYQFAISVFQVLSILIVTLMVSANLSLADEGDDDIDIMAIVGESTGVVKKEGQGPTQEPAAAGSVVSGSPVVDEAMDDLRGELDALTQGLAEDAFGAAAEAVERTTDEAAERDENQVEAADAEDAPAQAEVEEAPEDQTSDGIGSGLVLPNLPKVDLAVPPWLANNNGWALRLFFEDLTTKAHISELEVPIMREQFLEKIYAYLSVNNKPYTIVHGPNGVGKSMVPNALAVDIIEGRAPFALHGKRVLKLDFESLLQEQLPNGETPEAVQKLIEKSNVANRIAAIRKDIETYQNDVVLVVDDNDPEDPKRKEILKALANMLDRFPNVPLLLIGMDGDQLRPNPTFESVPQVEFTKLSIEQNLAIVMASMATYAEEKMVDLSPDDVRQLMLVMKSKVGDQNFPDSVIKTVYGAIDEVAAARITGVPRQVRDLDLRIAELDRLIGSLKNEFGEDGENLGPFALLQINQYKKDREDLEEQRQAIVESTVKLGKGFQFLTNASAMLHNLNVNKADEERKIQGFKAELIKFRAQESAFELDLKALEYGGKKGSEEYTQLKELYDTAVSKIAEFEDRIGISEKKIKKFNDNILVVRSQMEDVLGQIDQHGLPDEFSDKVDLDVMLYTLSKRYGLSMSNLYSFFSTPEETIEQLKKEFAEGYVGQEHFVNAIVQFERDGRASSKGPMYSALLAGGSTKGKTELSKVLGRHVNPDCYFSYDMGNYQGKDGINSFLGSAPGYAGDDGVLYGDTKNCAEGVLNFDEMDKTDPDIIKSFFYPLLREGIIRTKRGRRIDLRNFRIIMSTNALEDLLALIEQAEPRIKEYIYDVLVKTEINGLGELSPERETQINREMLETEARVPGRPAYPEAFLRRPTYIGLAANFSPDHYRSLVRVIFNVDHGKNLIESHRIKVNLTKEAIDQLAKLATNKSRDAAEVGDILRSYVVRVIKDAYNSGKVFRNDIVDFNFDGTNFTVSRLDQDLKPLNGKKESVFKLRSPQIPEHILEYYKDGYSCQVIFGWGI